MKHHISQLHVYIYLIFIDLLQVESAAATGALFMKSQDLLLTDSDNESELASLHTDSEHSEGVLSEREVSEVLFFGRYRF